MTVREELDQFKCTHGLWRATTADEIYELIMLWDKVNSVQLTDQEDVMRWRWTNDGQYSAKSAYNIQFQGAFCPFNNLAIWKAKVEGKHRFFAWLMVQKKLLTADNMQSRNWPCNPICSLCDQEQETGEHLCLHCVFAQEVWMRMADATGGLVSVPARGIEVEEWWTSNMQGLSKDQARLISSLLIYTT